MDIQLPGKDGITITKEIKGKEDTKDIPVFALTSYAMKGDREMMMEAGFDSYLSKPIKVTEFLRTIDDFFKPGQDDFLKKPVDKIELMARAKNLLKVKEYNDSMKDWSQMLHGLRFTHNLKSLPKD
jgi:CheY-like chemotaxis protein